MAGPWGLAGQVVGDGAFPWAPQRVVICNWRDSLHPDAGGAESYCEHVGRQMRAQGAEVTMVTARPPGTPRHQETDFGSVVRLGGRLTVYVLALLWLWRHRRHIDAVLDSQNGIPFFTPLAVGRRTPVALLVHHVHQDQFALHFPRPVAAVGCFLEDQVSRWVYGDRPVCVVSPSSRAEVRGRLSFKGPVFVTPCGQERRGGGRSRARSERPRITYVGRLVEHKRMELLLDAVPAVAARFPDVELHIVGDGPVGGRLRDRARALGLVQAGTVVFHGRVSDEVRDTIVASSWVVANPSVGEGWGLSVMEAASVGVPAVAFRVPGLRDAIQEGVTGWLVDTEDGLGSALVQALEAVWTPEEAEVWATGCRRWAGRFTWGAAAARLLGVLAGEGDRLALPGRGRRRSTDAATVVTLPRDRVSPKLLAGLRRHDQVRGGPGVWEVLLWGADESDALVAMERVGVELEDIVAVRIARQSDLVGWDMDGGTIRVGEGAGVAPMGNVPVPRSAVASNADGGRSAEAAVRADPSRGQPAP
ncbi:MAG TPA: glycosyltransferase family 4 protein [Acidimicrobiales bacterium]|nr:glycosyltransferase family 4 protein [Acidimicrobiales bacterium]